MNKVIDATKWIIQNFFSLTIVILVFFYLRWFRLTPFVFLDDPTTAFIAGLILLAVYGVFVRIFLRINKHISLKIILSFINIVFLVINSSYLHIHMPRIETAGKCNGVTIFITNGRPLLDEQWVYRQKSIWRGAFNYESYFLDYAPGDGPREIICDEEK